MRCERLLLTRAVVSTRIIIVRHAALFVHDNHSWMKQSPQAKTSKKTLVGLGVGKVPGNAPACEKSGEGCMHLSDERIHSIKGIVELHFSE